MSQNKKARRSRSVSPQHDEESDFQAALRLSEELNGGQMPLSSASKAVDPGYDSDADFNLAMEMQFGSSNHDYIGAGEMSASRPAFTGKGKAPRSEVSPWALKEHEENSGIYHTETPEGMTFGTLADFNRHVRSFQCSSCGNLFFNSKLDITMMLQKWRLGSAPLTCTLKCSSCSSNTVQCVACTPQAYVKQSVVSVQGKHVTWCCAGGRLFLLWLLLCDFDDHFAPVKAKELGKPGPIQPHTPDSNKKPSKRGGIGFGATSRNSMPAMVPMPKGLGFASDMEDYDEDDLWGPTHILSAHRSDTNTWSSEVKASSTQTAEDRSNMLHLELVEGLLPLFERESSFDFDAPDAVADLLLQSKILHYCTELLRNDSVEDATARKGVYQALINLLRTLGAHYSTASRTIFNARPSRQDRANLLDLCWQKRPQESDDKTSSIFTCLNNLSTQSALVLQGAERNADEFQSHDGQNLLLLCRQISDLYAYLAANALTDGTTESTESSKPEIPALTECPEHAILATHKHAAAAKSLVDTPKGRFKRLITELTTLKTGLPPGIFVRYADSRPDVQKILIVGPTGTPYENGLFEFDLFCDGQFPNRPPLVHFKTTGGGRVHFNPNLYPEGKVCLSLLGTWQGEPWVPNQSTLLQIVISIQAMILCEEPWYNEPGREMGYSQAASNQSTSYNQIIREHTVRTAILNWLEKTPPLWKDVVELHFKTNANKILKAAVEWSRSSIDTGYHAKVQAGLMDPYLNDDLMTPPPPSSSGIKSLLPALQKALYKYGAESISPDHLEPVTPEPAKPVSPGSGGYMSPYAPMVPSQFPFGPAFPSSLSSNPYKPMPPSGFGASFSLTGSFTEFPSEASSAASGGRGGTGRYETRSSTRGRGGPSSTPPPSGYMRGFGRGRGGASQVGSPADALTKPHSFGRGGQGGSVVVQAYPGGPNLWPFDMPGQGGRGGGRGSGRGGGRGNGPDDRGRGGRGSRDGRGGRGGIH